MTLYHIHGVLNFPKYEILLDNTVVEVRTSVHEVLNRFRDEKQSRVLWIDSLCINQDDLEERAQQVTFIYEIYRLAWSVLVWLGGENPKTNQAMEHISRINPIKSKKEIDDFEKHGQYSWIKKSTIFDTVIEPTPENRQLLVALVELLSRPWFTQIWIQQEAAAHRETLVFCGQRCVYFDHLSAMCWLLRPGRSSTWPDWCGALYPDIQPSLLAMSVNWSIRSSTVFTNSESRIPGFLSLMESTWACGATDPRDKVFALRSMVHSTISCWIPKINYRICWQDLYTDLAIRIIKYDTAVEGLADLLRCAGFINQQSGCGLPSWVPDRRIWAGNIWAPPKAWRAGSHRTPSNIKFGNLPKREQYYLRSNMNTSRLLQTPRLARRSTLILPCLMQDSISFLSGVVDNLYEYEGYTKFRTDNNYPQLMLERDQYCQSHLQKCFLSTYLTGESTIVAYQATLISNRTHENRVATPAFYGAYNEWHLWLNENKELPNEPDFEIAIRESEVFHRKQICTTRHGYICLVPSITESNDIVAILAGLDLPVVLRPRDKYYELLGCCYIHEMMEGQAYCLIDDHGLKYVNPESSNDNTSHDIDSYTSVVRIDGTEDKGQNYYSVVPTLEVRNIELI
ncbi:heterokaryon incompatibility protein-domain-containing protein [Xylogone sp. PMI_703]|nr:heterokaryon incompatibility protein-domain-containing protein [Xylogone sp. PMI_703]